MRRAQPEFELACVVVDFLRRALPHRAVWSHFPAGEARSDRTGGRLKRMGTAKGWADYLIFIDGNFIAIELKAPKGRLSNEQGVFGDAIVANGGHYTVARSGDAVEAFLRACGVDLRATMQKVAA